MTVFALSVYLPEFSIYVLVCGAYDEWYFQRTAMATLDMHDN